MRQIVLDTETTGLDPAAGHRIIEIGAVELLDRKPTGRYAHIRLDPERECDPDATALHGLIWNDLCGRPRFADIVDGLFRFLYGAEVLIHYAPFDVGFLDAELARLGPHWGKMSDHCTITCTRELARARLPGIRHSLDNLCDHFGIDRRHRTRHGALVDAQLLAAVYIAMTAGQDQISREPITT